MSCHGGTHFACECQRELLEDAVDSIAKILAGLEHYREGLALYDRGRLTKSVQGISGALSVLRRARLAQG
jgi:hypothetical protein